MPTKTLRALLFAGLASCGPPSSGTIGGKDFALTSAIVGPFRGAGNGTYLVLTDAGGACQGLKDGRWRNGSSLVLIVLKESRGGVVTDGTKAGIYIVSGSSTPHEGLHAAVVAEQWDQGCASTLSDPAVKAGNSGNVTLEADLVPGGGGPGSYALAFPGGGKLSGRFSASFCDATVDPGTLACGSTPGANALTLEVSRTGAGTGTVTSVPVGINCPPTCSATFAGGTATLTAAPDPRGSTFEGWGGACSGKGSCTVTREAGMPASQSVTATFGQEYSGTFNGSGSFTRPMTYGTCTWNARFDGSARLLIVGFTDGQLTGNLRLTATRTEAAGTPTDSRQTCLAGSASYDDVQPISGTPSAITWSANPLNGSSFLGASFTGAVSGNTGMLGGDTVSGTLTYSTIPPASGGATLSVTLSR